jgi:hypothetical protein
MCAVCVRGEWRAMHARAVCRTVLEVNQALRALWPIRQRTCPPRDRVFDFTFSSSVSHWYTYTGIMGEQESNV